MSNEMPARTARRTERAEWWKGESPWVLLLRQEYERLGLDRWNNDRVNATCRLLGVDIYTLCAVCGMVRRYSVKKCLLKNKWPQELTLQFWNWERRKLRIPGAGPDMAFAVRAMQKLDEKEEEAACP